MKAKKLMILSLIVFLLGGIFMNSAFVNGHKDAVYASLKEKYQLSSDTSTNEEITEGTTEENVETGNATVAVVEEKKEEKRGESSVTSRGNSSEKRTREQIVWDYLRSAGYSEIQTAAIIGNLYQESGLNPSRIESNGEGIGLVQWSFGRKQQLKDYAKSKGKDWTDLTTQLEFLVKELKGSQFYEPHKSTFNNPYSVSEATAAFCWGFERPNKKYANMDYREDMAWKAYYRNTGR